MHGAGAALRDALLSSPGIGQLPLLIASDAAAQKRQVPVLPQCQPLPAQAHARYLSNHHLSLKVWAIIELAVERFTETLAALKPSRSERGGLNEC
jgi:DNA-binding transcriptional LysR family regulator